MSGVRRLEYTAEFDGSVDDLLSAAGISSTVRVRLRKEFGLICKVSEGGEEPIKIIDCVKRGEKFCIYLKDLDVKPIPKWDYPINIVYQDEDIAVIDKQAGVAVIPTKRHYGKSLANALASVWGDFVYRPVNRLDRDTSGLMIVAKNQLAHSVLAAAHIYREYVGLCQGEFVGEPSGVIDEPIKRIGLGMKRAVAPDGDRAVTHYEVIKSYKEYFACRFILDTGRTHQIRVHTAHIGHPLCCDRLYNPGARSIICPDGKVLDRQALHSCRIRFTHPIDGRKMELTSPPPFLPQNDLD
ncbi:MAG: RluA family pseudouridine synthase [Clostridia bacterium]|nr:RluA family pseudouridine synthase [Clostridia bacterium]MDE7328863.1 RluA family pseudouridine synthase [Clostridia bacterium]